MQHSAFYTFAIFHIPHFTGALQHHHHHPRRLWTQAKCLCVLCPHLLHLVIITYTYYLLHITLRICLQFQARGQDCQNEEADRLSAPSPVPLEVGSLNPARESGERSKLPQLVWGGAPAEIDFGAF